MSASARTLFKGHLFYVNLIYSDGNYNLNLHWIFKFWSAEKVMVHLYNGSALVLERWSQFIVDSYSSCAAHKSASIHRSSTLVILNWLLCNYILTIVHSYWCHPHTVDCYLILNISYSWLLLFKWSIHIYNKNIFPLTHLYNILLSYVFKFWDLCCP